MQLLERDAHLQALTERLDQVSTSSGRLVFVAGEAGAGKTALIHAFARRVSGRVSLYVGSCDPLSTPQPLAPLLDIAAAAGTELQRLFVAEAAPGRLELFRSFFDWLAGSPRPALLVFEDLHWADEATLDLLRYLGRRIDATRTLLIGTYRNDEVGRYHPLRTTIGDLATTRSTSRLNLVPLSEAAVALFAQGSGLDPVELHRETGGNAFFVTEVIAAGGRGVPPTVRDAVLARASRLSPEGRATLEAAAVIGAAVEPGLLVAVLAPRAPAVEECYEAGVLRVTSELVTFRHELAREAVLDALPPLARVGLHGRALAALEARALGPDGPARLAHHASEAGDRKAVLRYAPLAGRRAASLNAHREATAQFRRALDAAGNLPLAERAALLKEYARECHLSDQMPEAARAHRQAIEIWKASGDALQIGEHLRLLARVLVLAGHNAESEEASRTAIEVLEALPPSPELAAAYQMQAHLRMLNRDNAEAIAQGLRAIELAGRLGSEEALIYAHNTVGSAMLLVGDDDGLSYLERGVAMARQAGLDYHVAAALGNLGSATGEMFQFVLADRYLAEGIAFCEERDLDYNRLYMLSWRALSHVFQGQWDAAVESAGAVLRFPGVATISRIMAMTALGRVRARRGDPEIWNALDEALELAEQTGTLQRLAPERAARAEAAWLSGDLERTRREARAVYDLAVAQKHPWHTGELGYWRWKAGDLHAPPPGAAEPYTLQISGEPALAARAWERLLCPYEAARALSDSDDVADLRRALEQFEQLGAAPMTRLVTRQLREVGARSIPRGPRPATRANPAGLTPRQLEVLGLLAGGLENREIAARLYISPKTVEHHVSAILSKLGAQTRTEAVAEALRLEIPIPR
jgi:DNA-binding CsgD family transcriptional regulator